MRKYYSLEEAEDMLPALKTRMGRLIKLSKAIDLLDSIDIQYEDEYETIKRDVIMNRKFHEYSLKFCKEIEYLLELGVVVSDIDEGLINFFSVNNGKEIFLCWKFGEDELHGWYDIASDYEFRRPISDLTGHKNFKI